MNYSKQREQILDVVKQHLVHPDAQYVYEQARITNPAISLATVYRNLNLLASLGEIKKIPMPNGSDRYDGTTTDHYHLSCNCCGKTVDIDMDYLHHLDSDVQDKTGFSYVVHSLVISGTCSDCIHDNKNVKNIKQEGSVTNEL